MTPRTYRTKADTTIKESWERALCDDGTFTQKHHDRERRSRRRVTEQEDRDRTNSGGRHHFRYETAGTKTSPEPRPGPQSRGDPCTPPSGHDGQRDKSGRVQTGRIPGSLQAPVRKQFPGPRRTLTKTHWVKEKVGGRLGDSVGQVSDS